jgi:peptidoglycan-N-acetylglucosamine deacetylase
MKRLLLLFLLGGVCAAQKIAVTFDDLPLNGALPTGVTRMQIARETLAVLKKRHVPPAYGFVNAKKLEGNTDAADALKLWAGAEPVGSHTYSHLNLTESPVEAFEREIEENEPVLELLASRDDDWHWFRYPYLHEGDTVEKRRACGVIWRRMDTRLRRSQWIGKIICGIRRMRDALTSKMRSRWHG